MATTTSTLAAQQSAPHYGALNASRGRGRARGWPPIIYHVCRASGHLRGGTVPTNVCTMVLI